MAAPLIRGLRALARLYGVQPEYVDVEGNRQRASSETLMRILRAFVPWLEEPSDLRRALAEKRLADWSALVEPVSVVWSGESPTVRLRLPIGQAWGTIECRLKLESGEVQSWVCQVQELPVEAESEVAGAQFVEKRLPLVPSPAPGYHQLHLSLRSIDAETLVIVAPRRVFAPNELRSHGWGLFVPLSALHSTDSWGAGDFSDLRRLAEWTADLGGSVVATLPLLPTYFDGPYDHSPYAPVSRLFWNEFYIDVRRVPELATNLAAQRLLEAAETVAEMDALRGAPFVEYNRQMSIKRRLLTELAVNFFSCDSPRRGEFEQFLATRPDVDIYARFRAVGERLGARWPEWPKTWKVDRLDDVPCDEPARQYYLYTQWVADEQLRDLSREARVRGSAWYLDLPLGTHSQGYDVWRFGESFAHTMRGGAPPDAVFVNGQDWGFPPLHPDGIRQTGYTYLIECLRHHLRYASLLRIDHVMSLHRLYWVPEGCSARDGAYVRYRAEELYAILSLESHRHQAAIVGENLGTVPAYVNTALARHRVSPMYVLEYELNDRDVEPLSEVGARAVASLNTHDLPTFAAFMNGEDIDDRVDLGLLGVEAADAQRVKRHELRVALSEFLRRRGWLEEPEPTLEQLLMACLSFLSASPAALVLINLEDLWLETRQQNVPGTVAERPNWRRRIAHNLDELAHNPAIVDALKRVNELRRTTPVDDCDLRSGARRTKRSSG